MKLCYLIEIGVQGLSVEDYDKFLYGFDYNPSLEDILNAVKNNDNMFKPAWHTLTIRLVQLAIEQRISTVHTKDNWGQFVLNRGFIQCNSIPIITKGV